MRVYLCLIVAWLGAGCAPSQGTWIAHGDTASVGVVRDGDAALAYVCGAKEGSVGVWTRWFATVQWQSGGFVAERDGWQLVVRAEDDALFVDVDGPSGEAASWQAAAQDDAGVYSHIGNCRDGAIVGDGDVTGAWCDADAQFWQVEPVGTLFPDESGQLLLQPLAPLAEPFGLTLALP